MKFNPRDELAETIRLQSTIGGVGKGPTVTVAGELDAATGVLLVDMAAELAPGAPEKRLMEGSAAVTDNSASEVREVLFREENTREAITAYFDMMERGLIVLEGDAETHGPGSRIERDGMDEVGLKFRLAPDIRNGQVAVIVLCWFAKQQMVVAGQMGALDDFDELNDMNLFGVGDDSPISVGRSHSGVPIGDDGWPIEP